jgi:hypothetical protein
LVGWRRNPLPINTTGAAHVGRSDVLLCVIDGRQAPPPRPGARGRSRPGARRSAGSDCTVCRDIGGGCEAGADVEPGRVRHRVVCVHA